MSVWFLQETITINNNLQAILSVEKSEFLSQIQIQT